jgi:hypothetical protein
MKSIRRASVIRLCFSISCTRSGLCVFAIPRTFMVGSLVRNFPAVEHQEGPHWRFVWSDWLGDPSLCWYAASPAAGEVKKRGDAEDHAADQRHNQEDQPPGRMETEPTNQPSKEQHQEKRLGHEHQSDGIVERLMQRGCMNERKVEKHAVRHDKSEDGESKQGFLLASAKRLHLFRRVCAQPANL